MSTSRKDMWATLGRLPKKEAPKNVLPGVEEATNLAYRMDESNNAPPVRGGFPWHTAFHASEFPGSDPKACARKALYGLSNYLAGSGTDRKSRAVMDAGKDLEAQIVRRWANAGILLSSSNLDEQTNIVDEQHWLSCSYDAILDLSEITGWNHPLNVDIKGIDHDKIDDIKKGNHVWASWQEHYFLQVMIQSWLVRKTQLEHNLWDHLDPCVGGSIYFVSRERPHHSVEVYVPLDEDEVNAGLSRLEGWKAHFLNNELPERPPFWDWNKVPCKWCPAKKFCKKDVKDGITKLGESHGSSVDSSQYRTEVLKRWE